MADTLTGKIYRVVQDKGYAWARIPGEGDYFIHRSELRNVQFENLAVDMVVEFTPTQTAKGPRATEVYVQ